MSLVLLTRGFITSSRSLSLLTRGVLYLKSSFIGDFTLFFIIKPSRQREGISLFGNAKAEIIQLVDTEVSRGPIGASLVNESILEGKVINDPKVRVIDEPTVFPGGTRTISLNEPNIADTTLKLTTVSGVEVIKYEGMLVVNLEDPDAS